MTPKHLEFLTTCIALPSLDAFMADRFTADEKSLYLSIMAARYTSDEQFPVRFDPLWVSVGYSRKDVATDFLKRTFVRDVDYVCSQEAPEQSGRGGRNVKSYALTVEAAEEFALSTGTSEGRRIRKFFVKALHVLQDYHFLTVLNEQKRSVYAERHQSLLEAYQERNVVYVAVVWDLEDGWVVKVGYSNDLNTRVGDHVRTYGKHIYLVYVFEAVRNHELETRLFSVPIFKQNVYNEPVNGTVSTEHFRVRRQGKFTLEKLVEIVRREGKEFKQYEKEMYLRQQEINNDARRLSIQEGKLQLDRERFEQEKSTGNSAPVLPGELESAFKDVDAANRRLRRLLGRAGVTVPDDTDNGQRLPDGNLEDEDSAPNTEEGSASQQSSGVIIPKRLVKTKNSINGPYVQMLEKDTFDIVKTFEGKTDAVREYSQIKPAGEKDISIPGLNGAVENSSIYHGYRWSFVARDKDPNVKYDIPPTNHDIRQVSPGWIAQLNYHKTEIISVFPNQKTASEANGFSGRSSICSSVRKGTAAGNNYFDLWSICAEEMKDAYVAKNGMPYFPPVTVIDAYDCEGKLIASYTTKQEVVNQLGIGHSKLSKILKSGELYCDRVFKWTRPPTPRKKKEAEEQAGSETAPVESSEMSSN